MSSELRGPPWILLYLENGPMATTMCWNCCDQPGDISARFCNRCLSGLLSGSVAGEPEYWINHPTYPSYFVSNLGRVKRRGKLLHPFMHGARGYPTVVIRGKKHRVHVMVLQTFIGPRPDGMRALHWDDNRLNNRLHNVHWGTHAANAADAKRSGHGPGRPPARTRYPCMIDGCNEQMVSNARCERHFRDYRREMFQRALELAAASI